MKQKKIAVLLILLFTLLCSALYIGYNYYTICLSAYKNLSTESEVVLMRNEDLSYIELKNSIKDKYLSKLNEELTVFSNDYKNGMKDILGEEYLTLENDLESVKKQIKDKKAQFLTSKEYLDKKQEMLDLKEKMDKADGEEYDKLYESFQKALSEISTLNVKLNNSLKDLKGKQKDIRSKLVSLFNANKDSIISFRKAQKQAISEIIVTIINEYNFELRELNTAFNRAQNKMREIPFDIETCSFDTVVMPFESEYFSETVVTEEEGTTKIEFVDANFKEIN